jgi:hypothetical protein
MKPRTLDDQEPVIPRKPAHRVTQERMLGPSDSSDTAADMVGLGGDDTSDRQGTGERASVDDDPGERDVADIDPDRVVSANQAGLGGGLDQAEEAQLGITDEELEDALGDPEDRD